MLNIFFHFNDATIETSRITQALWWQLSYFYQILQFCIKLLAWQVFAIGILLFNSRGTYARCMGSRRRFNVNMGFTDDDRILIENLYIFKGYGAKNLLKSFQIKVGL